MQLITEANNTAVIQCFIVFPTTLFIVFWVRNIVPCTYPWRPRSQMHAFHLGHMSTKVTRPRAIRDQSFPARIFPFSPLSLIPYHLLRAPRLLIRPSVGFICFLERAALVFHIKSQMFFSADWVQRSAITARCRREGWGASVWFT